MEHPLKTDTTVLELMGVGTAFGTFGELLQGVHPDNDLDFLVTFPINQYSRVVVQPDLSNEIKVVPDYKKKSARLASRLLEYFGLPLGGTLTIESEMPTGKGLASSSADLVATARAIESCYSIEIPLSLLQQFMKEIEPTDGVMYPEVVSFYHREVQLGETLGVMPALTVVAIDEGGEVDTIEFNQSRKPFTTEEKQEYAQLISLLKTAFREGDVRLIGQVATRSAIMNQVRQEKRSLNHLLQLSNLYSALGVVAAHSGTFIGILLYQEEADYHEKLEQIVENLKQTYGKVHVYHSL